jgi:GNAT superfamily N-acetyltransferase
MLRRGRPTRRRKADKLESQTTSPLPNLKTEQDDPYRSYEVNFKIPRCLTPYTEPDDYILEILGDITCNDDNGSDTIAGTVKGYIIQLDRIINDGESLFDACDAHSQTVHDYSCVLFDFRRHGLKRAIERQFRLDGAGDILILDKIEVLPAYRGRGLGLAAACSFLDTFETGSCLAVGEPYPLQFKEMTPKHAEWCKKMGVESFVAEENRAVAKLRAYWSRLGFRRIRGSKKYALSLEHRRPALEELVPDL